MTGLFLECTIRAALIVVGAALVLYALRVKVAAVKHRVWMAVMLLMLALPPWTAWGPKAQFRLLPAKVEREVTETAPFTPRIPTNTAPFTLPANEHRPLEQPMFSKFEEILGGLYLFGVLVLLVRLAIGTTRASRLVRKSVESDGIRTSAHCAAPVTVGCLRPTVILPEGWREWRKEELEAILAHEREHVRRRDPLVQWLTLLNRAIFWFHPAAWWLERELSGLAEESCDAAVIAQGHHPRDYADALMNMARAVMKSGSRVNLARVAMPGRNLPQRILLIVEGRAVARISRARVAGVIAACLAICGVFAVGVLARPRQSADQSGRASTDRAKFEVASVKPCDADSLPPPAAGGRGGGGILPPQWSPGRLTIACRPVAFFIMQAYVNHADGQINADQSPMSSMLADTAGTDTTIDGLPDWGKTLRFTIETEVTGDASRDMMMGPMMQSLLEDRFRLKLHVITKAVPGYDLLVAKGGPKLPQSDKSFCRGWPAPKPGGTASPEPEPGDGPRCTMQFRGVSTADLARLLAVPFGADRPIVDKTGISGRYDVRMLWAVDQARFGPPAGGPVDPSGLPTIFEAVKEQLGLELVPSKGSAKELVIDYIEEPSPN
jgi:bla regulator protein blaR1